MKHFRSNPVTTVDSWKFISVYFWISYGMRRLFSPQLYWRCCFVVLKLPSSCRHFITGALCNCTRVTQSWSACGAGGDSSSLTRFAGLSHIFSMGGNIYQGSIRDSCGLFPFSRKAHRKGLAGVLHIIISRVDALLLNCWIKGKQKSPFSFSFDAAVL